MPAILAGAVVIGLVISLVLESFLQPRPGAVWRRPCPALALHAGLWLLTYALLLLICRRPWFALVNVSALVLLLILVNNAKYRALREPFLFQDFEYFTDAVRHPRLYLPFLPIGRTVLAGAVYLASLAAGLKLEDPLNFQQVGWAFWACWGGWIAIAATLLWAGNRAYLPIACEPAEDLRRFGLLASLWRYAREEFGSLPTVAFPFATAAQGASCSPVLPDLVVIQSESFFDPRRTFPQISREILSEFDRLKATARHAGTLNVPAWGANTVRAEFAFLSGVPPQQLGVHQFNPYRRFARRELPTLPRYLKGLGYRTIFIHPYPLSFYTRDKVFPLLGFDECMDIREFSPAEKSGPYIGDKAVAERIVARLSGECGAVRQPCFIFAVTMENHGPLHLEKVQPGEAVRYYRSPPLPGCDELTVYLRHLENADTAFGMVRGTLEASPRPGVLCVYGDHVPIMAEVYRRMPSPDGKSDYLIWQAGDGDERCEPAVHREVESLGGLLLQTAGLLLGCGEEPAVTGDS